MNEHKKNETTTKSTRSQSVLIRLTPEEYRQIKELAEALGVSMADIFRDRVFKGEFPHFRKERLELICEELPKLIKELNHIGNNINQIAKHCNRNRVVDFQVLRQLEELNEKLGSLLLLVVRKLEEVGRASVS